MWFVAWVGLESCGYPTAELTSRCPVVKCRVLELTEDLQGKKNEDSQEIISKYFKSSNLKNRLIQIRPAVLRYMWFDRWTKLKLEKRAHFKLHLGGKQVQILWIVLSFSHQKLVIRVLDIYAKNVLSCVLNFCYISNFNLTQHTERSGNGSKSFLALNLWKVWIILLTAPCNCSSTSSRWQWKLSLSRSIYLYTRY